MSFCSLIQRSSVQKNSSWAEFHFWFPSAMPSCLSDSCDVCIRLLSTHRLIAEIPSAVFIGPEQTDVFSTEITRKVRLNFLIWSFPVHQKKMCWTASYYARGQWWWGVFCVTGSDVTGAWHNVIRTLPLMRMGWINCQQTCHRQILEVNWTNSRGEDYTRTGIPRALWVTDVITLTHIKFSCIRCVESKTVKLLFLLSDEKGAFSESNPSFKADDYATKSPAAVRNEITNAEGEHLGNTVHQNNQIQQRANLSATVISDSIGHMAACRNVPSPASGATSLHHVHDFPPKRRKWKQTYFDLLPLRLVRCCRWCLQMCARAPQSRASCRVAENTLISLGTWQHTKSHSRKTISL